MADEPTTVAATLALMQVCAWESSQHALHSVGTTALFLLSLSNILAFSFRKLEAMSARRGRPSGGNLSEGAVHIPLKCNFTGE